MSPSLKKQTAFRIDEEVLEGLQRVKDRDGIPVSEQVRRALRAWLDVKDIGSKKTRSKRADTRKPR